MRKFKIFLPILVVLVVVAASFIPPSTSKYYGKTHNYSMTVKSKIEKTYYHTGNEQSFTIPVSGYYYISAWGGNGGKGGEAHQSIVRNLGGSSQKISCVCYFERNIKLYIYVGSGGESKPAGKEAGSYLGGLGGTNGLKIDGNPYAIGGDGGVGYKHVSSVLPTRYSGAGGGGGAGTFVCTESQSVSETTTLICSGGGGGAGGGSGNSGGKESLGGEGGKGGSGNGEGSIGGRATNEGAWGGSSSYSQLNGTYGIDGGEPSGSPNLKAPGGGGGGGGSGYNGDNLNGGSGGNGGLAGASGACKGGGGGKGGSSYVAHTEDYTPSTNHTRPTDTNNSGTLNGAVMITFLGAVLP